MRSRNRKPTFRDYLDAVSGVTVYHYQLLWLFEVVYIYTGCLTIHGTYVTCKVELVELDTKFAITGINPFNSQFNIGIVKLLLLDNVFITGVLALISVAVQSSRFIATLLTDPVDSAALVSVCSS